MQKLTSVLSVAITVLCSVAALAQAPAPAQDRGRGQTGGGSPDPGVSPTTAIDRAEVRILRVEVQPGATRRVHQHDDVVFHLFMPVTGTMELTVPGESSQAIIVEPWHPYFMKKGTPHGFKNTGTTPVLIAEIFVKGNQTADIRNADDVLALAFAGLRP